jgi:arabinose-5-phosphate isomerase
MNAVPALSDEAAIARIETTIDIELRGLQEMRAGLSNGLAQAFLASAKAIEAAGGAVVVTGMGKSGHVGKKIAATLASTGTHSHFVHPAEASHGDLGMIAPRDVVLALSWSGEVPELANIITYTRRFGIKLIAITSRPDSALGRAADIGLFLPAAEEACPNGLAPTTSTTMQLVAGDALAMLLLDRRGFSSRDFSHYHPGGKLGAQLLTVGQLMHKGNELPLVTKDTSLSQGIVEMTSKRFGIAAVVDEAQNLIGVLTDGDLRRAFQKGAFDITVEMAMGKHPQTVTADVLAAEVLARMNNASQPFTCMFVVDGQKPVGVVHIHDLLRAGVA